MQVYLMGENYPSNQTPRVVMGENYPSNPTPLYLTPPVQSTTSVPGM